MDLLIHSSFIIHHRVPILSCFLVAFHPTISYRGGIPVKLEQAATMATFISLLVLSSLVLVVQGVLDPCGAAFYDPTKVRGRGSESLKTLTTNMLKC